MKNSFFFILVFIFLSTMVQAQALIPCEDFYKAYKPVTNTNNGKKIYLDEEYNSHYRTFNWVALLGLVNANWVCDSSENCLKYGFSARASALYLFDSFIGGIDLSGYGMLLSFTGTPSVDWGLESVVSFSSVEFHKNIALRAGFVMFGADYGEQERENYVFKSPVIGFGLHDVKLGDLTRMKTGIDYYVGHVITDTIDIALSFHLNFTSVLEEMADFDIHVSAGVQDVFMVAGGNPVNDLRLIFAIGVGNYK